jgi:DOPA 4,5-dioxygenase
MTEIIRPVNSHQAYHAHVYLEQKTLSLATSLCERAGERFGVRVGRVHQKKVGPHPKWSCQLTFGAEHFDSLVPWLESNREGLSILIHALTGNDLKDHTTYAYWLGDGLELDLSMFDG